VGEDWAESGGSVLARLASRFFLREKRPPRRVIEKGDEAKTRAADSAFLSGCRSPVKGLVFTFVGSDIIAEIYTRDPCIQTCATDPSPHSRRRVENPSFFSSTATPV